MSVLLRIGKVSDMDRYWEGQHGTVVDFDTEGPTHSMTEYAAYTTKQLITAFLRSCEPWEIDWITGQ